MFDGEFQSEYPEFGLLTYRGSLPLELFENIGHLAITREASFATTEKVGREESVDRVDNRLTAS